MAGFLAGAAGGATVAIVITAIDNFSKTFNTAQTTMLKVGTAMTAIGVAGAFAVGGLLKMAGQFEQTQIAFTTMLGSGEEADKLLKKLADFASRTPFTIPGIEQNAKLLLGMGVAAEDMIPTLKALGDVSAGLSVPLDRIAINFGQIRVQGKLTGRELRDFAVAGVPLIAELAKNFNLAEKEIAGMVSRGEIGFKDVENAFITMTSEGGRFFDLMDAQSKTFLGQVSNIQDSFTKVAREMGEVFLPAAKFVAESLADIIGWFEQHPTIAKWTAVFLGVVTVVTLIAGPILILIALLPALAAGFALVTGVLSPWLAIILGIIAAITLFVVLIKNWKKILVGLFTILEFLAAVWTLVWFAMKNVIVTVWNAIVSVVEAGVNKVVDFINFLIRQALRVPGIKKFFPGLKEIKQLDFSAAKGEITDLTKKWTELMAASNARVKGLEDRLGAEKEITSEIEKQKDAVNAMTKEQKTVQQLQGFKVLPTTGDVFNPKAFQRSEFETKFGYEQAKKGAGIEINIENVNGLDPDEVAAALQQVLRNSTTL